MNICVIQLYIFNTCPPLSRMSSLCNRNKINEIHLNYACTVTFSNYLQNSLTALYTSDDFSYAQDCAVGVPRSLGFDPQLESAFWGKLRLWAHTSGASISLFQFRYDTDGISW